MTTVEDVLEHHGVKGMRWGQKKGAKASTIPKSAEAKRAEASLERLKAGGPRTLTNHQISQLNKRLEMEKKLGDLHTAKKHRAKVESGQKLAKQITGVEMTAAGLYAFSRTPAGKAVGNAIRNKIAGKPSGSHFAK